MNSHALIPINQTTINEQSVNTVNAKELYGFLGSKRKFSDWIKERIQLYSFEENTDFVVHKFVTQYNQIDKIEYYLSLDMAKEICMVERNEKGKQARQYFIECERVAKSKTDPMTYLNDPASMRTILLSYTEKVIALEEKQKVLEPKANALDRIATADGSLNVTESAKSLQVRPKALFQWLSANKWIYRRTGGKNWLAYQPRIQQGVLEHKVTTVTRSDGTDKIIEQVLITPKGLARLAEVFSVNLVAA